MTDSGHVHLEPVGGIAGDMFVAAMLDLFPQHLEACWQDLRDCGVLAHVNVDLQSGVSKGLVAKRLQVALRAQPARRSGNYRDLRQWLADSALDDAVRQRAQAILLTLAEAEAQVHGVEIEQVHFHEVADWDSIVDVVAAASLIERAGPLSWSCGPLPLGSGLVRTEHGMLPVPAPATAWLLKGLSVWDDGEPGERVTPTGAAIVRSILTTEGGRLTDQVVKPAGVLLSLGCGAGQRDLQQRPNVLRCLLIDTAFGSTTAEATSHDDLSHGMAPLASAGQLVDEVAQLSFDIDDMTPEELSVSLDHIRAQSGVLDASFQLAVGKKGRALFKVTVLCRADREVAVSTCCLEETSTLGMRVQILYRRTLERELHEVGVGEDAAGIKAVRRPSGTITVKVESDDLGSTQGLQARRLRARRLQASFES